MNIFHLVACLALLATTSAPPTGPAEPQDSFFIVFKSPVGGDGPSNDRAEFQKALQSLNIAIKERFQYGTLVNGLSASFNIAHLAKLRAIPCVKGVYPLMRTNKRQLVLQEAKDERLQYVHGITGVMETREKYKVSGKGIKVGIIDTGIDYTHPALGGCFGKGCKVAYGYDFVGDEYTGENEPKPDNDPLGCIGHGTHVAGIVAAASKEITGVAPDVTLGAYKVGGCSGRTESDVVIKAMERALEDKMDIINLSIGWKASWDHYPVSLAAQALSDKGIVVVCSAGNEGKNGLFYTSAPSLAEDAISVASFDSLRYLANGFQVDGEPDKFDYSMGFEYRPQHQNVELVSAGNGKDDFLCAPLTNVDVKGKIVLAQRGGGMNCGYQDKSKNARAGGALAVLVYNSEPGMVAPMYMGPFKPVEPYIIAISQQTGQKLLARLGKGKTVISFPSEPFVFDTPTGGHVSVFSSWGPTPELGAKPEIGAPGGLIFSTYPVKKGSFATMSGTSMASPYIAGVVALLLEAKKKQITPKEVKVLLQNAAVPTREDGSEVMHPAVHQGAGLVNLKHALASPLVVTPSKVSLLSTDLPTKKLAKITIKNTGKYDANYRIVHKPAKAILFLNHTSAYVSTTPVLTDAFATFEYDKEPFKLEPGRDKSLNLFFNPPTGLDPKDKWIYSGYIVIEHHLSYTDILAGSTKYPSVYVPYVGMNGDYKTFNPLAGQSVTDSNTGEDIVEGQKVNLKDSAPVIRLALRHPAKHITITVVDAASQALVGTIADQRYIGLDDTETVAMGTIAWDGTVAASGNPLPVDVPNGKKVQVKVAVMLPFGQDNDPKDWTTWTSPAFVVDRDYVVPQPAPEAPITPEPVKQEAPQVSLNDLVPKLGQLLPTPAGNTK